ncbi:MAG TPA: hypothetical protein IAB61_01765 [Candidatus Merdisoma merdipullorum]|nr:hypothetical protein [Candidatus Merdisoma merdipullorum]
MSKINLEEFAGGALQEKFDEAFEKTVQNMLDPNTPWKNKRKITVEITLEQNEDRSDTAVNVSVVMKLAPVKPVETRMVIGKNLKTGEVFAEEYGKQIRGQMSIDDYQMQEVDGKTVDTETGEIKETEKVLDFRAKQA